MLSPLRPSPPVVKSLFLKVGLRLGISLFSGCSQPLLSSMPTPSFDGGNTLPDASRHSSGDSAGDSARDAEGADGGDIFLRDVGSASAGDAASLDTGHSGMDAGCTPGPCRSHILIPDRQNSLQAICLDFEEVRQAVGLPDGSQNAGASVVDYDGDHRPDIYLLKEVGANQMFHNQGGNFQVAQGLRLNLASGTRYAAWRDVNGDGNLDVVIGGDSGSALSINDGRIFAPALPEVGIHDMNASRTAVWLGANLLVGTENGLRFFQQGPGLVFEEVSAALGLDDFGDAHALAIADYNGDGLPDIYVANSTGVDRLFMAQANGMYQSVEMMTGTQGSGNSTDAQWIIYQPGASTSLYVSSFGRGNSFFVNMGNGAFQDRAGSLGIRDNGNTTRVKWGDFAGNGYPHLVEARSGQENLYFIPEIDAAGDVVRYQNRAPALGLNLNGQTVGLETLDYDGDARQDLLVILTDGMRLYHNISRRVNLCH